jgi:hypothetical protein
LAGGVAGGPAEGVEGVFGSAGVAEGGAPVVCNRRRLSPLLVVFVEPELIELHPFAGLAGGECRAVAPKGQRGGVGTSR